MPAHRVVHQAETCPKPRASRRWQNTLWICPTCQRAWVLRFTVEVPPREHDGERLPCAYDSPVWSWWPWSVQ